MSSYSGGSLAAGATCTITVDVTSAVAESHRNDTERVTSSLGTSTAASATLTVEATAPGFTKVFSPATIRQGEETQIVFTVDNGAIAVTGMAFDDSLPSGVSVADTPGAVNQLWRHVQPGCGRHDARLLRRHACRGRHVRDPGDGARHWVGNANQPGS